MIINPGSTADCGNNLHAVSWAEDRERIKSLTAELEQVKGEREECERQFQSKVQEVLDELNRNDELRAENLALRLAAGEYRDAVNDFARALDEELPEEIEPPDDGGRLRAAAIKLNAALKGELTAAEAERVRRLERVAEDLLADANTRVAVAENAKPSNIRLGQVRELRWWTDRLAALQDGGEG